jgi:quercetin dioxygenase-like cupin family protein
MRANQLGTGCLLGVILLLGLEPAIGQTPPTETRGVTVGQTAVLDLGAQIERVQGRLLRLRVLTIEPGGVVGLHSHKDRPAVVYIIQGALTEYREGGAVTEHHAGSSWAEGKDVIHWAENRGPEPLVLVAVDVFKQGM